jgi:pilus retraction protein PilT
METVLEHLILDAFTANASDVFLMEGEPPRMRGNGDLSILHPGPLPREALAELWHHCGIAPENHHEADVSWRINDEIRLRVNLYHSLGRLAAALRPIQRQIPEIRDLGLPAELLESWMSRRNGLILVTGPTGSGKSTTVAACLAWLNRNLPRHVVTLEDPIEFLYDNELAMFSQREVRLDSESFATGLRAALRQSPDVIFLGEIRDAETAVTALNAAETGHLVISTLHSGSVPEAIERFSHLIANESSGVRGLLAAQLIGVITQHLLPRPDGGLFAALEYLQNEAATRRWIFENRTAELQDHLHRHTGPSTLAMLDHLVAAVRQGVIEADVGRAACPRPQDFDRALRGIS